MLNGWFLKFYISEYCKFGTTERAQKLKFSIKGTPMQIGKPLNMFVFM